MVCSSSSYLAVLKCSSLLTDWLQIRSRVCRYLERYVDNKMILLVSFLVGGVCVCVAFCVGFFLWKRAENSKTCCFSDWSYWSDAKTKLLQTLNQVSDLNSHSFDWQEILWPVITRLKTVKLKTQFQVL